MTPDVLTGPETRGESKGRDFVNEIGLTEEKRGDL